MTAISHLELFYETRLSPGISPMRAAGNPNTGLNQVPDRATIHYRDDDTDSRVVTPETFADVDKGFEIARFLIERAMMDPDATVDPLE